MTRKGGGSFRVLHIHGSLAAGNPLAERSIRVLNALGPGLRHGFVSGDDQWSALNGVVKGVAVERFDGLPKLDGFPLPGRLQAIARAMVDYHLVLTYGRGAIAAALAHTSFSDHLHLPPLIHHEDGSDETPKERRGLRSSWYRRVGLGKAAGLVVPTELMEGDALVQWQQPIGRVKTIADGANLDRLRRAGKGDAIPRLLKRPGEFWIGCSLRFDGREAIAPLITAMREVDARWHLVMEGEGSARTAAMTLASDMGLDDRVHIVPPLAERDTLTTVSDIVAIVSPRDPLPLDAILAMGASKPVVGFECGELAAALSVDNTPFIAAQGDATAFSLALQQLAADDFLRRRIGAANREKAETTRDAKAMIAKYRRLYDSAMQVDRI